MRCVVCANPIPTDRRWDSITCSKECGSARTKFWKSQINLRQCKYCQRPTTPEERARFQAWRRWEKTGQKEETSAAALLRENQRLKRKLADTGGRFTFTEALGP